jgi:hypothetical protein
MGFFRPGNRVKIYRVYPSEDRPGTTRPMLRRVGMIIGFYSINRFYYA